MWIQRLTLSNFRNYRAQELTLAKGPSLLLGDNAQGKSNLLEAAFLLATTRSTRAQTEGELIHWDALSDPQPVARVAARIERRDGPIEIEVVVVGRPKGTERSRVPASKRLRVNGVPKRQADVVGQLTAVLFSTDDMKLISGAPSERRRYLDVMLSQLQPAYMLALQRYGKVVSQRNALLRRIQSGESAPDELDFWDEELAGHGALLVGERAQAVEALAGHARQAHRRLSGNVEELAITYAPRIEGWTGGTADEITATLREALASGRQRDIGAGVTLTGPHRDDLIILLNDVAAVSFASRGQERTAALALRLAEARYMADCKDDLPVVLLDDVLSELDEDRRRAVLSSLEEWDQILITSADGDRFDEGLPASTAIFRVSGGAIQPM